jgi:hypothetical protein
MKLNYKTTCTTWSTGLMLIILIILTGCKKETEIIIDLDVIKTNIFVEFRDANTNQLIGLDSENQVDIQLVGQHADQIVDPSGYHLDSYHAADGIIALALDPSHQTPSNDNPFEVLLVISSEGYLTTNLPIKLLETGDHDYVLMMVDLHNPGDGISVLTSENIGQLTNGTLESDIEISTNNDKVKVTLYSGTMMSDRNGNQLNGELSATLVHFDPAVESTLDAFPGGLDVTTNEESGYFISAGFIALEITDESGRKAENFENESLDIEMIINPEIINPETSIPIQTGDEIPLWSYDIETGIWSFEKNIIVQDGQNGPMVKTHLEHLSYWNLDWFSTATCRRKTLHFVGDETITGSWPFSISVKYGGYKKTRYLWLRPGSSLTLDYLPVGNLSISFDARQISSCDVDDPTWLIDDIPSINLCQQGDIDVPVTLNPLVDIVTVKVFVICKDTGVKMVPVQTLHARFRKVGDCWRKRRVSNGEITVGNIEQNNDYEIQVYYKGKFQPNPAYVYHYGDDPVVIFEPEIDCGG